MGLPPELATIAATLRTASSWIPQECAEPLLDAATAVEECDLDLLAVCCPVCQEIVCDTGCPLEPVRDREELL